MRRREPSFRIREACTRAPFEARGHNALPSKHPSRLLTSFEVRSHNELLFGAHVAHAYPSWCPPPIDHLFRGSRSKCERPSRSAPRAALPLRGLLRVHEPLSRLVLARETASSFEASGSAARARLSTRTHALLSRVIHALTLTELVRIASRATSLTAKFTPRTLLSQSPRSLEPIGKPFDPPADSRAARRLRALIFNVLSSRQLGFFVSERTAPLELLSLPSSAPAQSDPARGSRHETAP